MLCRLQVLILFSVTAFHFARSDIYRLPKNVKPVRYILTMEPHLESDLTKPVPYDGSMIMELNILKSTRNITFHKKTFEIDNSSITIVSSKRTEIKPSATTENEEAETYTIHLENELVKGENYNLTIGKFSGYLADREGFFLVTYWVQYSNIRGAAVTHFEPTGARTAFPCFDEPAMKASFIVNLIRREEYNSVSNKELDTTENLGNGRFKDTFKETPKMSTFIVAFAISDFKPTQKVERHRIFAMPGAVDDEKMNYSITTSVKILQALEKYTEINFTLSKMDQFAVPDGSFKESAMENWGLAVYVESYLFSVWKYPYRSPQEDLKRCTITIAHEFTHQWFGNLVTPEWWDYLWLSESLAAYFQYYIGSVVQPTWNLMDQFVIDVVHKALREEENTGAHQLNFPVQRSGQYPPFHIMYEKGGSILRMTANFLTQDVFQTGLQIYLQKGKFGNTVPADLYSAFQEAVDKAGVNDLLSNIAIEDILGTWDSNEGFPVVTVTRNYTSGSIEIEQEAQSVNWSVKRNWKIPINYVFSAGGKIDFSKTTADYWLVNKSVTISNKDFSTDGWLLLNKQQTGYYRVNYDLENWERLIQFMNSDDFKSIHILNRAQLIDDSFNLAHYQKLPSDIPLRLCEYLIREKNYIPWAAFYKAVATYMPIYYSRTKKTGYQYKFFNNFSLRNNLNSSLDEYDVFQEYIRTVTSGLRDYLKMRDESKDNQLDSFNRYEIDRYYPYYFV